MTLPATPAIGYTNLEASAINHIYAFSPNLEDLAQLGQGWYESANVSVRAVARAIDKDLGHHLVESTATVMAILSPQMRWEDTLLDAYAVLREELGAERGYKYMAIGRNVELSRRFLRGDYVPRGPKVTAFAKNLIDPWAWGPVTLDGRMARLLGVDPNSISKGKEAVPRYRALSSAFERVAQNEALANPQSLQAGIWMLDRSRQKGRKSERPS